MHEQIFELIEWTSIAIELFAIAIIVVSIVSVSVRYGLGIIGKNASAQTYNDYRARLGRGLLLCLEILVAADIIRTVALDPTLKTVGALGLLILIRTFLGWSLTVEIEGKWPWQSAAESPAESPSKSRSESSGESS